MSPTPTAQAAGVLVDGPAPRPPLFSLIGAAQVVPMTEDEHYVMGVALRPLACGLSHAWDGWNHVGDLGETEKVTFTTIPAPAFRGFAVYMRGTCNTRGLGGIDWADRIGRAFASVETYAVEREFWTGALLTANPSLTREIPVGGSDLTVFPGAATVHTAIEGLALIEGAIATSGRAGLIHSTPAMATHLSFGNIFTRQNTTPPTLQTVNGTVFIPGYGYQTAAGVFAGSTPVPPAGKVAPTGTQEWMIATGPVEIRRSEPEFIPGNTTDEIWQGVDRANNQLAYEALRYYVVDWDTCFKAAVLIDRTT